MISGFIYPVLYLLFLCSVVLMFLFLIFGIIFLKKSFRELKVEKRDLELTQKAFSTVSHYTNAPSSDQYDAPIISQWISTCKNRVDAGLSTTAEVLENSLFDVSGKRDSSIRFIITSLIILGLLGTFLGMTRAVFKASEIIVKIETPGSTIAAPGESVETESRTDEKLGELLTELEPILGGMKIAFATSIMGLSFSIGLGIAFAKYRRSRDNFRIEAMVFANEKLLPIFTPETDLTLGKAVESYSKSMEMALQRIEQTSSATFQDMASELKKSFQSIKEELDASADSNINLIGKLANDISEQNESLIERITDTTESLKEQLRASTEGDAKLIEELTHRVNEQNESLVKKIADTTEHLIEANLSRFQRESKELVNKLDEVVESHHAVVEKFNLNSESVENLIEKIGESSDKILNSSFEFSRHIENMESLTEPIAQLSARVGEMMRFITQMNPRDPLNSQVFNEMRVILVDIADKMAELKGSFSEVQDTLSTSIAQNSHREQFGETVSKMTAEMKTGLTELASRTDDICDLLAQIAKRPEIGLGPALVNGTDGKVLQQINDGINEIASFYRARNARNARLKDQVRRIFFWK